MHAVSVAPWDSGLRAAERRAERARRLARVLKDELEDLARPPEARRCGDAYLGPHGMVSQQFLVDAHRAQYRVAGESFCFDGNAEATEAGRRRVDAFGERLAAAVCDCLGASGGAARERAGLVRLATMLLSQAGLALVGMACLGPQLAISGGERTISYELKREGLGERWDIQVGFLASGFREYFEAGGGGVEPVKCSPASSLRTGCAVRLAICRGAPHGISIDVRDVVEDVAVVPCDASPSAPEPLERPPAWADEPSPWWLTPLFGGGGLDAAIPMDAGLGAPLAVADCGPPGSFTYIYIYIYMYVYVYTYIENQALQGTNSCLKGTTGP